VREREREERGIKRGENVKETEHIARQKHSDSKDYLIRQTIVFFKLKGRSDGETYRRSDRKKKR
jgi:hypothetical protein